MSSDIGIAAGFISRGCSSFLRTPSVRRHRDRGSRPFEQRHALAAGPLADWLKLAEKSTARNPHQLKATFAKVSILGGGCTVFNIAGNNYRLIARVNYAFQSIIVLRVLTHAEYERIPDGKVCP